jgi:tRNA(fMet)-specific endonuclease VapC
MKYMLDSNIIVYLTMNANDYVARRAAECDEPPVIEQLRAFVEEVPVLDFDYKAALAYASLPFRRGSFDRLIAAHALSHDLIMVTHNEKHFADVPGLKIENWTVAA